MKLEIINLFFLQREETDTENGNINLLDFPISKKNKKYSFLFPIYVAPLFLYVRSFRQTSNYWVLKGPPRQAIPAHTMIWQHQQLSWPIKCLPDVHCIDTCQNISCNWDFLLSLQFSCSFQIVSNTPQSKEGMPHKSQAGPLYKLKTRSWCRFLNRNTDTNDINTF